VPGQQVADLELDQVEQLGVVDGIGLVERHDHVLYTHLPGDEHMLVGLRHVVPGRGLVLDVRQVDRDAPDDLLDVLVDPVERRVLGVALLGEHLGDRGGERRLAVVDVTHRSDVQVRLGPHERLLHVPFLWLANSADTGNPFEWLTIPRRAPRSYRGMVSLVRRLAERRRERETTAPTPGLPSRTCDQDRARCRRSATELPFRDATRWNSSYSVSW
jgi:hypothetical protein